MKNRILFFIAAAGLLIGAAACAPVSGKFYYTKTPYFEPTNPDKVKLLRSKPRRPHIRLGEVWIRPEPGMTARYVEGTLRARAAALGADAVVIVRDRYHNHRVVDFYWYGHSRFREREIVGIAIRYR